MSGPGDPRAYQQGPYQQGPYQQGFYGPAGYPPGPQGASRPVRYRPGVGLALGLIGLICSALSLFALSWADGSRSGFTDLSSAARDAGRHAVGNTALYLYLAWAGYVLLGVTVVLAGLALIPLPSSVAGNTYARVGAAVTAGAAAVLHIWTMHKIFQGDATPHVGAWLGLLGYLGVLVATIIGARRVAV